MKYNYTECDLFVQVMWYLTQQICQTETETGWSRALWGTRWLLASKDWHRALRITSRSRLATARAMDQCPTRSPSLQVQVNCKSKIIITIYISYGFQTSHQSNKNLKQNNGQCLYKIQIFYSHWIPASPTVIPNVIFKFH